MPKGSCLVLFTKPGTPGRVKTRLIGKLTAEQAADIHNAFVGDVVERLQAASIAYQIAWALGEGESLPADAPGFAQQGDHLGERLHHGLLWASRDYSIVAAIGSDHPDLPLEHFATACDWLRERPDIVLGPATDGGYFLIACRSENLAPGLFEQIDWSTERVLRQTRERARAAGLETRLLPHGHDVDTPEDLLALAERLRGTPVDWCPRTKSVLTKLGLYGG